MGDDWVSLFIRRPKILIFNRNLKRENFTLKIKRSRNFLKSYHLNKFRLKNKLKKKGPLDPLRLTQILESIIFKDDDETYIKFSILQNNSSNTKKK